jgi:AI-2 transport protein TqsA
LLALVLWGWMWGPAGMLLSVPLTVLLKELLAVNPSTRWIAELLGPNHNDTPSTLPSRSPVTEGG